MKHLITSAILILITAISFAQDRSESSHLIFKGVPIDGTLREYVSKMEKSGFTHVSTQDGVSILKGDFAAYKNCIVGVMTLNQKDLVSKIAVMFPECETWSSLSSNYFNLKELLTEKYGEPSESVEKFEGTEPKQDDSKMHQVKFDNCKYYTTYNTDKGTIQLSIGHDGASSCFVQLTYSDKINSDIIRAKAKDDL